MPLDNDSFSQQPIGEDDLPPSLRDALGDAYGRTTEVPPHLDRMILSAARAGFARRQRTGRIVRWVAAGAAVAAVVVISVRTTLVHPTTPAPGQVAQVGDVNHDGRIDILDAYLVARAIDRHERLDPSWDMNGDGSVDQKDVDWIAALAVHVSGGGTPR